MNSSNIKLTMETYKAKEQYSNELNMQVMFN